MKLLGLVALIILVAAPAAMAIPALQLYIEGSFYDVATETWFMEAGPTIRVWAVGAVGDYGSIYDVKMAVAYESGLSPAVTLTSSTTMGYNGFTDGSGAPGAPSLLQTVTDGSAPVLGDGSSLPGHGIYGNNTTWHNGPGLGTDWQEFSLGDFTSTADNIADFNGSTNNPTPHATKMGQVNVYEFSVANVHPETWFHFDLYDHYYHPEDHSQYVFAPFSHDAQVVPEPGTIALLGLGLAGVAARMRRKKQS